MIRPNGVSALWTRLEQTAASEVCVLSAWGELDLSTLSVLRQGFEQACAGAGSAIIIDLRVGFVDSSGIALLLDFDKTLRRSGGRLVLATGSPALRRIFSLTGLDRQITVCKSRADAEAALTPAAALTGQP